LSIIPLVILAISDGPNKAIDRDIR
jgi:hypothetical protein